MITIPGRIPVRIHPIFFFLIVLLAWTATRDPVDMLIWGGIMIISILVHEYGHALAAMAFGQRASITMMGLGGITEREGPQLKPWQEFLVVLNGPGFGFLLAALGIQLRNMLPPPQHFAVDEAIEALIFINLLWSFFNLLPIGSLDGGRILSIVLEKLFGITGVRIAWGTGIVLGTLCGIASIAYLGSIWMGALFSFLAYESYQFFQATGKMTHSDRDDRIQAQFQFAEHAYQRGDTLEALEKFQQVRQSTQSGILHNASSEYIAHILSEQGEFEDAYDILLSIEKHLSDAGICLIHRIAYYRRDPGKIETFSKQPFNIQPSADTAFINALGAAMSGKSGAAVGWLRTAEREGMDISAETLSKGEFDPIRNSPSFQEFASER
jgi:Zn-dependent protease